MNDTSSFWVEILRSAVASSAIVAAGWGALGGVTSALTVRVTPSAMLRQIALGALVAGGTGTLAMAIIAKLAGLDPELIPMVGAASSASYFAGVFGPAIIEVILSRIHAGRLPGDNRDD